jgi:hypothetical protein
VTTPATAQKISKANMMRLLFFIFFFLILSEVSLCQSGKSTFYPEGYGMLYKREKVNFVSINTENKVESLFKEMNRQFGSPIVAGEYTIYKYINRRLSNRKIVVRISQAIQTDLNNKRSNLLFIFVETQNHVDLLHPQRLSSKELKTYFNKLFLKQVLNAPLDTFGE